MKRTPRGAWSRRARCLEISSVWMTRSAPRTTFLLSRNAGTTKTTVRVVSTVMMVMTTINSTSVKPGRCRVLSRMAYSGSPERHTVEVVLGLGRVGDGQGQRVHARLPVWARGHDDRRQVERLRAP